MSLAAARRGLKVALVEARDVLGGNHSSEYRVHMNGAGNASPSYYGREAGISDEIKLRIFHQNPRYNFKEDYHLTDMTLFDLILSEPNITLYLGTQITRVNKNDNKILSLFGRKTRTEEDIEFISPLFADGTGDGFVAYTAGAEFRYGREAKSEFSESFAPEKSDSYTMGSCILFNVSRADKPVPFVKPPFAYDYKKDGILAFCERPETGRSLPRKLDGVTGIWWLSVGGTMDSIKDDDKIDLELKKLVYGFWDYVKNSGDYENVENYYLSFVAPHLAKRESRRFIGDYILKEKDILDQTPFYDSVSTGGWSIDIHDPEGVYGNDLTSRFGRIHGLYNIPYRIMYSKDIDNLFLIGRIVSATHVALGSLRVMQTLGAMAQAVGSAAVLCKKYNVLPRDIADKSKILELQEMLQRDGQYISGKIEDVGLASMAKVTASDVATFESVDTAIETPLDKRYVLALPLKENLFKSVKIRIKNTNKRSSRKLKTVFYSAYRDDCYQLKNKLFETETEVNAGFDGWLTISTDGVFSDTKIIFLMFEECPELFIFTDDLDTTGAPAFIYDGCDISKLTHFYPPKTTRNCSIGFKELLPEASYYAPENIINGISRPIALPNSWRARIDNSPTLSLDFSTPCDITEIQILFNAQLQYDHFSDAVWNLIKHYKIEIEHENGVYTFEERDNYLALNRHKINLCGVKNIKFTFFETHGARYAEVFSVKVF